MIPRANPPCIFAHKRNNTGKKEPKRRNRWWSRIKTITTEKKSHVIIWGRIPIKGLTAKRARTVGIKKRDRAFLFTLKIDKPKAPIALKAKTTAKPPLLKKKNAFDKNMSIIHSWLTTGKLGMVYENGSVYGNPFAKINSPILRCQPKSGSESNTQHKKK